MLMAFSFLRKIRVKMLLAKKVSIAKDITKLKNKRAKVQEAYGRLAQKGL